MQFKNDLNIKLISLIGVVSVLLLIVILLAIEAFYYKYRDMQFEAESATMTRDRTPLMSEQQHDDVEAAMTRISTEDSGWWLKQESAETP